MPNHAVLNRAALNAPGAGRLVSLAGTVALGISSLTPTINRIVEVYATSATAGVDGTLSIQEVKPLAGSASVGFSGVAGLNSIRGLAGASVFGPDGAAALDKQRILGGGAVFDFSGTAIARTTSLLQGGVAFIDFGGTLKSDLEVQLSGSASFGLEGVLVPGSVILGAQGDSIGLSASQPGMQVIHRIYGTAPFGFSPSQLPDPDITTLLAGEKTLALNGLAQLSHYDFAEGIQYKDVNGSTTVSMSAAPAAMGVDARMTGRSTMSVAGANPVTSLRVRRLQCLLTNVRFQPTERARVGVVRVLRSNAVPAPAMSGAAQLRRTRKLAGAGTSFGISSAATLMRGDVFMAGASTTVIDGTAQTPIRRRGLRGTAAAGVDGVADLDKAENLAGTALFAITTNLPELRPAERLAGLTTTIGLDGEASMRPAERFGGAGSMGLAGSSPPLKVDRYLRAVTTSVGVDGVADLDKAENLAGAAGLAIDGAADLDKAENLAGAAGLAIDGAADLDKAENLAGTASFSVAGAPFYLGVGVRLAGADSVNFSGAAGLVPNPLSPAPLARQIVVEPKPRSIPVEPKSRTIRLTPDDRGIIVYQFDKQPAEVVDYDIDMTRWFDGLTGDEIESVAAAVSPAGLTLGPGALPETSIFGDPPHKVKIWVGGGTDRVKYKVTVTATTSTGRVEQVDFTVKVRDR